jgi:hypothetical protein
LRAEQLERLILSDRVAFHQDSFRTFVSARRPNAPSVVVFREAQEHDLDAFRQAAGS